MAILTEDFENGFQEFGGIGGDIGGGFDVVGRGCCAFSLWADECFIARLFISDDGASKSNLVASVAKGIFADVVGIETGLVRISANNFAGFMVERDSAAGGRVVVSQHIIISVLDDASAAAIISHERDVYDIFRKIVGEVDEVIDVGTSEAVNRLPIVTDREKVR